MKIDKRAFANAMILWYGIMRISKQNLCSGRTIHHQYTHDMTTIIMIIIVVMVMTTCEWMLSEQKCGVRLLEDFPLNPPSNILQVWWLWKGWWWEGGWFMMMMMMMIVTSKPESGQRESLGARSQLVRFTLHVAIVMFTCSPSSSSCQYGCDDDDRSRWCDKDCEHYQEDEDDVVIREMRTRKSWWGWWWWWWWLQKQRGMREELRLAGLKVSLALRRASSPSTWSWSWWW